MNCINYTGNIIFTVRIHKLNIQINFEIIPNHTLENSTKLNIHNMSIAFVLGNYEKIKFSVFSIE